MSGKCPAQGERQTELARYRELKMARSVHNFARGAVADFYQWLDGAPTAIPDLPRAWICGDCHIGNLGPVADEAGRVDIEIRDLDQSVIGNPAHDLLRLGLSLVTAARSSILPGVATSRIVDALAAGYREALAGHRPPEEPAAVRLVRKRALGRHWHDLVQERTRGRSSHLPRGKRFWNLKDSEVCAISDMLERPGVRSHAMSLTHPGIDDIRLVDAAYWRKGCSSLGFLRVALLLGLTDNARQRDLRALVDVKEAVRPVAPARCPLPDDHAIRVVTGACALAPNLGERMIASELLGRPVVIRELKPQDLKLEIDQFKKRQGIKAAAYLGYRVGRAHARQLTTGERRELRGAFSGRNGECAPDWFWCAIVDLAARSEAAYLTHCRRIERGRDTS